MEGILASSDQRVLQALCERRAQLPKFVIAQRLSAHLILALILVQFLIQANPKTTFDLFVALLKFGCDRLKQRGFIQRLSLLRVDALYPLDEQKPVEIRE